jgi:hypothetical protein
MIFTFAASTSAATGEDRKTQDIISTPQACTIFCVLAVLHAVLHYNKMDTDEVRSSVLLRGKTSVGGIVLVYAFAVVLCATGVLPLAAEIASAALELIFAVSFIVSAFTLHSRILEHGEEMVATARKFRRVCVLVSICSASRFVVFFPLLQSHYGSMGPYAVALFNMVDMTLLGVSVASLHSR